MVEDRDETIAPDDCHRFAGDPQHGSLQAGDGEQAKESTAFIDVVCIRRDGRNSIAGCMVRI